MTRTCSVCDRNVWKFASVKIFNPSISLGSSSASCLLFSSPPFSSTEAPLSSSAILRTTHENIFTSFINNLMALKSKHRL